jgi:pyrimidine operon attenuation protein / uracil phosphoribosyltransferase
MKILLTKEQVERTLKRMTHEIIELGLKTEDLIFFGILNKGFEIASIMANYYEKFTSESIALYPLNIKPFRDDDKKEFVESTLNVDITHKYVILIDDVLFTGRSVRAGFDAVLAYGRPKQIKLAVLIDRGHRELPIRPDFIGKNIPTSYQERVVLDLETMEIGITQ